MSVNYKKIIKTTVFIAVLALPVAVWTQRWNIHDTWRLRGYEPPTKIAELATQTTMNKKTRRLFYVYQPSLDDKGAFNDHCKSSEQTIVLGCYVSGTGVYLFNVTDDRINGVQQVTAAHEMLHVAYERLSSSERKRINGLIDTTYSSLDDQRIKDTIEDYRAKGADISNELHSILGTEVRSLPQELEKYYSQYFIDRSQVVTFSEKYEQAFTARKDQAASYSQQMDGVKVQLDSLKANIDAQEKQLSNLSASLRADRESSNTQAAVDAFNARVDAYNAQVNTYQQSIARYNGLVSQYNELLAKYNTVANEELELIKAIDSRSDSIPAE